MNRFRNYDNLSPDYKPDNRPQPQTIDETDEIIVGGTCYHVFCIPYLLSELICEEVPSANKIYYLNGLSVILTKGLFNVNNTDVKITEDPEHRKTFIEVRLNPEETKLFKSLRETKSQIRIMLNNGDVLYTKDCAIRVIETLGD